MKAFVYSCVAVALSLGGAAAFGEEESPHAASGTIALTTEYLFRGISQTDHNPAIQGSLDYTYKPWGLYLGAWASNVDEDYVSDGNIEIDWYGGFRGQFSDTGIGWDAGAIYYHYPGDDDNFPGAEIIDYVEAKFGANYTFADVPLSPATSLTVYYSPDFFGGSGDGVYVDAGVGLSLPYEFTLGAHGGYQYAEDFNLDGDDGDEYFDWRVGISRTVIGFTLNLSYSGVASGDEFCAGEFSSNCDDALVFTVSRSL